MINFIYIVLIMHRAQRAFQKKQNKHVRDFIDKL